MDIAGQIKRNAVSLCSLAVALTALGYNTWRNESTEGNRNVRAAEFEMLKQLGEIQQVIDYAHLRKDTGKGDLTLGLARVLSVRDLATLTPKPVEDAVEKLQVNWARHAEELPTNANVAGALSEDVLLARRAVLTSLRLLK